MSVDVVAGAIWPQAHFDCNHRILQPRLFPNSSNGVPLMGTWSFSYDSLNRLAQAQVNQPGNSMTHYCWSYDAFGNR